jgi:Tfp pilus assembly protein PilF
MRLFAIFALLSLPASADTLNDGLRSLIRGDYPSAEQQLAQAVAEQPRNAIAHFNYASALRELGRYDEAVGQFQVAFREGDDLMKSNALYGIGMTRAREGDPARTAQAWRDYVGFAENRPRDAAAIEIARTNLAAAEHELGTRKAAR